MLNKNINGYYNIKKEHTRGNRGNTWPISEMPLHPMSSTCDGSQGASPTFSLDSLPWFPLMIGEQLLPCSVSILNIIFTTWHSYFCW